MSTTFAPRVDELKDLEGPLTSSDIKFSPRPGFTPEGKGERIDNPATPFARFASRSSFAMTNKGATILASAASDTGTTWDPNGDSNLDDR